MKHIEARTRRFRCIFSGVLLSIACSPPPPEQCDPIIVTQLEDTGVVVGEPVSIKPTLAGEVEELFWAQTLGPSVGIDTTVTELSFTPLEPGQYSFTLTLTNRCDESFTEDVAVAALPEPVRPLEGASGNWSNGRNWPLDGDFPNGPETPVIVNRDVELILDRDIELAQLTMEDNSQLLVVSRDQGNLRVATAAGLTTRGRILVGRDRRIDTAGTLLIDENGLVRRDEGASASTATIVANQIQIAEGRVPGALYLSDGMIARVDGDITLDGEGVMREGCNPPIVKGKDSSRFQLGGSFILNGRSEVDMTTTEPVRIGGNFENSSDVPMLFNWTSRLVFDGEPQATHTFEAAGRDLGAEFGGFDDNFSLDSIEVASGHALTFVDFDANTTGSCEAVYVRHLEVGAGATVQVNNCNVYYESSNIDPSDVVVEGCGSLAPIISTCSPRETESCSDLSLFTKETFTWEGSLRQLQIGQLNEDCQPDLLVTNTAGNWAIVPGTGDARFDFNRVIEDRDRSTGYGIAAVHLDEFPEHEGTLDVLVSGPQAIRVYPAELTGRYSEYTPLIIDRATRDFEVCDLNGDLLPDLVVSANDDVYVLLGEIQPGTFEPIPRRQGVASNRPLNLTCADLDDDGRIDIIAGDNSNGQREITILYGLGDGRFEEDRPLNVGGKRPWDVAVGDVNNDGLVDIVTTNFETNNLSICTGSGDRNFNCGPPIAVGNDPAGMEVVDMDADGDLDVVLTLFRSNELRVLRNPGNATFAITYEASVGPNPRYLTTADLDDDGDRDIVVAAERGEVTVFQNRCAD